MLLALDALFTFPLFYYYNNYNKTYKFITIICSYNKTEEKFTPRVFLKNVILKS